MEFTDFMRTAVREAEESLREGSNGFGAVVVKNGRMIASARDTGGTAGDFTSHAELNAIRAASGILGPNLHGCILVSTHEPCPMCAFAAVRAGIRELAFGVTIRESISEGWRCTDYPCADFYKTAGADVTIHKGVLHDTCSLLYRRDVRAEIKKLLGAGNEALDLLNEDSTYRRLCWFDDIRSAVAADGGEPVDAAYRLLLRRFGVTAEEMPVVRRTDTGIVFHSKNFCPTLEACRILGLDTRHVCRRLNERSTDTLVKQIDPRLTFSRNYDKLRPYTDYCEEMIELT